MILNSPYISGSLTVTGNTTIQGQLTVTGSLSGTASLASNALLLQGTGSTGFATTASINEVSASQQSISASLLQVSASYIALSGSYNVFSGSASTRITENSSSIQQISASLLQVSASYIALSGSYTTFSGSASTRVTQIEQVYATTGSNSFRANQSITGSLVVSSTITAQTLIVQTVTSSIIYSSGSNNFGNQLANTQTFTGSVNITGSLAIAGNITSNGTAVVLGSGTSNYLPKFTAASTIGNSLIYDNATSVFINATSAPALGSPKLFVKQATANTYEGLLVASSANNNVIAIAHTGTQGIITTNYGTSGTNTSLAFGTNGAGQMTLDTSGNLGLGVTASAWNGITALQIGGYASFGGDSSFVTYVSSNAYYNAGWKYIGVSAAANYYQDAGAHYFRSTSTTGTAGGAITWITPLTIASTGLATFSGVIKSTSTGQIIDASSGTTGYLYQYFKNTTGEMYFGIERSTGGGLMTNSSAYATILSSQSATNLEFGTSGTRRITIASNGKVSISAPTTADAFTVQGANNYWTSIFTSGTTTSQAYGVYIKAGTNASDVPFLIHNTSGTDILRILGTGAATFSSTVALSNFLRINASSTTSVSTSATTISTVNNTYGGLAIVWGADASGNIFTDLVFYSLSSTYVINGQSVSGSPVGRTYTCVSGDLKLAMASGTYSVRFQAVTT